ncbi:divergent polysaccharide deacetylase family protein [Chelativorans sp. YIM 93263]|uniref:divergent polysaccharide deacetylase family protein n=1 Tax=Chelativorans sp. YIM 93263 TaxID=2906648 RepID=UPI002378A45B|nr:divergent polysaccharide deacetylase family protein [Chelativorans sp. YIM 93263]
MEPDPDDIDQPLGRHCRSSGVWRRPRAGSIVFALCVLVIFAGSSAIALRDRSFQQPPEIADADAQAPEAEVSAGQTAGSSVGSSRTGSGPAVIQVDREALPHSNDIVIRDPAALNHDPRLAHLPDRSLIEETDFGPLPIRSAEGLRPFDAYARPWSGARGARIAIVVGGLGISQTGTQAAIEKLPEEITLAFAPQGNSLDRWMRTARQEGHEIILQVPLEPFDYSGDNHTRHMLLVNASARENREELHRVLARITNYTGVMNYQGARFTADEAATEALMQELGDRGLLFLDDGTSARSLTETVAARSGVPFAESDDVIDARPQRGPILEALDSLERVARARGFAVGVGSALDTTVNTVADWAREARKRGIELVPISAVAFDPERD